MINVGVIGCGKIGQLGHLLNYSKCPNAQIIAVADNNINKAKEAADKFNISHVYSDYHDLLNHDDIDAVSIAVPNYLHAEITIAACEKKKHILLEKPMATTIQECEFMIKSAKDNNVYLMLAHSHRFNPTYQIAKNLLDNGIIGKINTVTGQFGSPGPEYWSPEGKWFFDKKYALGGAMADLGIHEIDLLRWLVNKEVKEVAGFIATHEKKGNVDDSGVCIFRFENNILGMLYASWTYKPGGQQSVIYGEKGTMYFGRNPKYDKPLVIELTEPKSVLIPDIPSEPKTGNRYQYFINCIERKEKPFVDGVEGMKSMEIIFAVYLSYQDKRIVELPLPR